MARPVIYLDNHASTPLDPRVRAAMDSAPQGNAASAHAAGRRAAEAVERARAQVAALAGARPEDVVFTSSATESNNTAVGTFDALVVGAIEHRSVLVPAQARDARAVEVSPQVDGVVRPSAVVQALVARGRPPQGHLGASLMLANNEVGTVQPTRELWPLARQAGAFLHVDAAQGAGYVHPGAIPGDLVTLSSHKLYGPQGVGALVVREGAPLRPLLLGGTHEGGRRASSPNTAGAVGMGAAAALMLAEGPAEAVRLAGLRDELLRVFSGLVPQRDRWRVNGSFLDAPPERWMLRGRLPQNLHLTLLGVCPESLSERLDSAGLMVSSTSACASHGGRSHVLEALGLEEEYGAAVRISVGRFTTVPEVRAAAEILASAARDLYGAGCSIDHHH